MERPPPKDRPTERAKREAWREEVSNDPERPTPPRRPYSAPSVLHADELRFETELQCVSVKTAPCTPSGCSILTSS